MVCEVEDDVRAEGGNRVHRVATRLEVHIAAQLADGVGGAEEEGGKVVESNLVPGNDWTLLHLKRARVVRARGCCGER